MAVDATAISRVLGITTKFFNTSKGKVQNLPQRIAVIGQGNTAATYSNEPQEITSAGQAATLFGYGSPLHLAISELFPLSGGGVGSIPVTAYPLDDAALATAAVGAIAATGTSQTTQQTYVIKVNKIATAEVTIPAATVPADALALFKAAIDAVLKMPVTTGTISVGSLPLTSKWKGASANDIYVEIVGTVSGLTFTVTQPVNGATNPDVDDALDLIGTKWETIILNCLNYNDTTTLDKYSTFNDGRWGTLEYKPLFAVSGTNAAYAARSVITDARKLDKTNCIIPAVGCYNLPCVIAAAAVAKIAPTANNNPPMNYADYLTSLTVGSSAVQENYATRDLSIKKGASTTTLESGYVRLNDTVTCYHPDDEVIPGYRYVCDIVKLQNIIYNLRIIFEGTEWKGAPLIPDATPTTNPTAKKPKDIMTVLGNLADNLAFAAIISEPTYTQENMSAVISGTNPKRIDTVFPVKLSGNLEVNSIDLNFGFYFGGN